MTTGYTFRTATPGYIQTLTSSIIGVNLALFFILLCFPWPAVISHWGFSVCVIWIQKAETSEIIIKLPELPNG